MSAPTSQQAERSASAATDPTAGRWAGLWRRGRRTARAIAGAAAGVDFPGYRRPVEVLESRTLFTSLLGGQSLIFQDENGNTVRALLTGPGRAELIGTHFDPSINGGTTALLNDVPATITNPDGTTAEILGGFGGQHGVFPIQAATGVPDSFTQLNGLDVPRGIIALRGITSNTAGVTYAFNEFNTTTGTAQHVVQLNTVNALGNADANTQANLAPAIVAATGAAATTDIAQIVDADFQPDNNNLIWFVAVVSVLKLSLANPTAAPALTPVPFLLNVNIGSNAVTNFGEFSSSGGGVNVFRELVPDIQAFTFDNAGNIVGYGTSFGITGTGEDTRIVPAHGVFREIRQSAGGGVDISPVTGDDGTALFGSVDFSPVTLTGTEVTDVIGFEVIPGEDPFVYAISPANASTILGAGNTIPRLLHVRIADGVSQDFGQLPDPTDASPRQRGQNISSLAWNPLVPNLFTSTARRTNLGALIGPDTNKDELDVVSNLNRFPSTSFGGLFSIYVTGTTKDTNFSLSVLTTDTTTGAVTADPYGGNGGVINGGAANPALALGPGGVFVGSRTPQFLGAAAANIAVRRVKKPKSQRFGTFPVKTKYVYAGVQIIGDFNNFLVGGTVTGRLNISGNISQFYGGSLLFGDPSGRRGSANSDADIRGNVYVGGEIRNLLSASTIGTLSGADATDPAVVNPYSTGFDMVVKARIGQVLASTGSIAGSINVTNKIAGFTNKRVIEVEDKTTDNSSFIGQGRGPSLGGLGGSLYFNDDSFDHPQYIGSSFAPSLGTTNGVEIEGFLENNDPADYYAMGMLAGQTVTVQLTAQSFANVAVFDPDGRLIATDFSDINAQDRVGQPFRFTADRPGAYRFAVVGGFGNGFDIVTGGAQRYIMRLNNTGNVSLGAVVAGVNLVNTNAGSTNLPGINVGNGDLGVLGTDYGLPAGGGILDDRSVAYQIAQGNFRSAVAGAMSIDFLVTKGAVGLLRTTTGNATLNSNLTMFRADPDFPQDVQPDPTVAVGTDVQIVDAAADVMGNLSANRVIGVLRSGFANFMTSIIVNADNHGNDGVIDLIAPGAQLGDNINGGPDIWTNDGGNVRYLRFDTRFFTIFPPKDVAAGFANQLEFRPGQTANLVDDSGTNVDIQPGISLPNPAFGITPNVPQFLDPGMIWADVYPVADKRGIIIAQVWLDPPAPGDPQTGDTGYQSTAIPNHSLIVTSRRAGKTGSVEIGNIYSRNTGQVVTEVDDVIDPTTGRPVDGTIDGPPSSITFPDARPNPNGDILQPTGTLDPVNFTFQGNAPIDVFNIDASTKVFPIPTTQPRANINNIINNTPGEIVSVQADSVGLIQAETVGLTQTHVGGFHAAGSGGMVVESNNVLNLQLNQNATNPSPMPFRRQRNGIFIGPGNLPDLFGPESARMQGGSPSYLLDVRSRRGLGNIGVVGILSNVEPNYDGKNVKGVFEGINAPIVVLATTQNNNVTDGRLQNLNIGEGLPPTGTGDAPQTGVYVGDTIERISNQGRGSDIRGLITVGLVQWLTTGDNPTPFLVNSFDGQQLGNLTLNDGAIIDADIHVLDEVFPSSFDISSELVSANTRQFFQFDFLDPFNAPKFEIGQINVSGSGGIIGSLIQTADIGPITVGGGFGILNSQILSFSDSRIANITTDGYGLRDDIIEGGASMDNVRANGNGELLNANAYTPSVRNGGKRPFEPYSGIVPNASNDLYRYLGVTEKKPKKKSVSEAGVFQDTTVHALLNGGNVQAYKFRERRGRNRVTFGNTLGEIVSLKTIDGLTVSAGSLKSLIAGSDVARLKLAVAGPISRVQSNGTIKGSSVIRATGPDGRIGSITTKKSLYATIRSTIGIDNITVGDSVGSKIIQSPQKIGTLAITNSLMTGATVDAHLGTISKLIIGGDVQAGAVIAAKAIDKQKIGGTVEGDIIVK